MAIPFLNNVSLTNNEIQNVRLHNTGTSNAAAGQIFFNTSTGVNLAQYYANAVDLWVSLKEYSFASGTYVGNTVTGTAAKPIVTVDLSAIDGVAGASERYLTKTNKWAEISTIPGTYTWKIEGDTGPTPNVDSGSTISFVGGTNMGTGLAGDTLTINLNDSVTLAGQLTASGTGQNSFTGQVTIPILPVAQTDAASKDYVDNAVVGGLVYQGGYDAATNTPVLDSRGTQIAVNKGWTYTVTVAGTFYGEVVEVGDVLIAEDDLASGAGALTDWTTVQNNIDLASLTQVGIGNVNAGTGISVAYTSGTATVTNTDTNGANTARGTLTAGNLSGTVTHAFGINTIVQTINAAGDTVFCDVTRTATTCVATISVAEATDITILVQNIS
jgi:hypothetical protein